MSQGVAAQGNLDDPRVTKQSVISRIGPAVRKFQKWKYKEWEYREETQSLKVGAMRKSTPKFKGRGNEEKPAKENAEEWTVMKAVSQDSKCSEAKGL